MAKVWIVQDPEEGKVYGVYSSRRRAITQAKHIVMGEVEGFQLNVRIPTLYEASWSLTRCKATGRTKERYNGVKNDAPGMFSKPMVGYNIFSFDQGSPCTWAYGGTEEQAKENARVWFDMVLAAMKEGTKPDEGSFKGEF